MARTPSRTSEEIFLLLWKCHGIQELVQSLESIRRMIDESPVLFESSPLPEMPPLAHIGNNKEKEE